MYSTCFEPEGSSSGRGLYMQLYDMIVYIYDMIYDMMIYDMI